MIENLRIGLVGSGFISQFQVKALEQLRGVEVNALLRRRDSEKTVAANFVR